MVCENEKTVNKKVHNDVIKCLYIYLKNNKKINIQDHLKTVFQNNFLFFKIKKRKEKENTFKNFKNISSFFVLRVFSENTF